MKSTTQQKYWNKVAWEKEFTHPLDFKSLEPLARKDSHILDYGCGYGRIIEELSIAGFTNSVGVDSSSELIKRARDKFTEGKFYHIDSAQVPFDSDTFDCVIIFAVLTCIPDSNDQVCLLKEIHRLLKPGGILYLSDYLLQAYELDNEIYDNKGVFSISEGATFRHHTMEYFKDLFAEFTLLSSETVPVKTMLGSDAEAIQFFLRK